MNQIDSIQFVFIDRSPVRCRTTLRAPTLSLGGAVGVVVAVVVCDVACSLWKCVRWDNSGLGVGVKTGQETGRQLTSKR